MTITTAPQYVAHVANALLDGENSDTTALDQTRALREIAVKIESMTTDAVIHARENGASWADVGAALGVTKQAAQQAYGRFF